MALSVVLPMYQSADFVVARIGELVHAMDILHPEGDYEIIVVDDGSVDNGVSLLQEAGYNSVRVLSLITNQGKFAALKQGIAASTGKVVVFTDADLPYSAQPIATFSNLIHNHHFDLAVGDRTLGRNGRYSSSSNRFRHFLSLIFSSLVRLAFTAGVPDTQCGIKAMQGDLARILFPSLDEDGFAGDVELIYLALHYNLSIRRVPVEATYHGRSSVSGLSTGILMLIACVRIKVRQLRGRYSCPDLENYIQAYWSRLDRPAFTTDE